MKKILFLSALCVITVFSVVVSAGALPRAVTPSVERELLEMKQGPGYWSRIEKIAYLKGQLSKFLPVPVACDTHSLSARERKALERMIEASRFIDAIFFRQVYRGNEEIKKRLELSKDPLDTLALHYFMINFGPFDRLNGFKPFIGDTPHPGGADFYPPDLSREEFEKWLESHPGDKSAFKADFTVIRRKGNALVAVPYSEEYRDLLAPAARALEGAAAFSDNESLKKYLLLRAKAFASNDYYESDLAWMEVKDSPVELVIGPYEVYEDSLFNFKASFEAYVVLNLPEEAKKFTGYTKYLRDMEAHLPFDDMYKDFTRDFSSPIRIVNEIYSAGDGRAGVHTSAFALPNDEKVRKERGCKKIMLKNIMAAKFKGSTYPIAKLIIAGDQLSYATFDAYFRDTVFHELSHGLGPRIIKGADGTAGDVRTSLKDSYSAIEECKADTLSVYNQLYLMEKGIIPKEELRKLAVSYLAGIFRSVRFGLEEAHGRGSLVQLMWMMEKGGFSFDSARGVYSVNFEKFGDAAMSLSRELLEIEATGDYERSRKLLHRYAKAPPHLLRSLKRLSEIPVDIEPLFECNKKP
jgi:hypothetical protein